MKKQRTVSKVFLSALIIGAMLMLGGCDGLVSKLEQAVGEATFEIQILGKWVVPKALYAPGVDTDKELLMIIADNRVIKEQYNIGDEIKTGTYVINGSSGISAKKIKPEDGADPILTRTNFLTENAIDIDVKVIKEGDKIKALDLKIKGNDYRFKLKSIL